MADSSPLSSLKDLKPWQKWAVAIGGGGVAVFVYIKHKQDAASAASTAASTTAANAGTATPAMVTDPTTGTEYPATATDPDTGLTYQTEIDEYGSVAAADEQFYGSGGDDLAGGVTDYGQTGYSEVPYSTTTGYETGDNYTTNAAWSQAVESGLTDLGYSATDISTALGYYFAGRGLTPDQANIIYAALAEYGPPPAGNYQVIQASTTGPATTGTTATSTPKPPATSPPNIVANTSGAVTTITWGGVGSATKFNIQLAEPNGKVYKDDTLTPQDKNNAVFDNLVDIGGKGKAWHYKIRAGNTAGWGPWSAVKSFTP